MSAGAGKKGGAGAGADAVTGSRTGLPQPSKHATDFEVRVVARVRGHPPMTLRASRYGATGNYQLQNVAENRPYFDLINSLGANTKYITLKNDLWIQQVGHRSTNLMDANAPFCTSFTLSSEPTAPRKRDEALKESRSARKRSLVEIGVGAEGAGAGAGAGPKAAQSPKEKKKKAAVGSRRNPLLTALDSALLPQSGPFIADV